MRSVVFGWILLLLFCCSRGDDRGPLKLFGNFEAGMTLARVKELATESGAELRLLNDYSPGTGHTYQRWSRSPCQDRVYTGECQFDFFDAQLMTVAFLPNEDGQKYLDLLSNELHIPLDRVVPAPYDRRISIRATTDYEGRPYAAWTDRQRQDAHDDWMD